MRTKEDHIILGEIAGAGGSFLWSYLNKEKIGFWDLFFIITGPWIGSILPDIVDPPTNPNHRALGHSLVGNNCLSYLLLRKSNEAKCLST